MNQLSPKLVARIQELNRDRRIVPLKCRPRLQKLPGIHAVLFDVYGTMVDSGTDPFRANPERPLRHQIKNLLRYAGFEPCCPRAYDFVLDAWRERIEHAHRLAREHGVDYPEVDIRNIWRQALKLGIQRGWITGDINTVLITRIAIEFEGARNPVTLMPGIINTLARLRQRGIKMGIVSNAQFYTPLILQILFGASLAKLGFDRSLCIWSYRFGRAKPSPDLLNLALKRLEQKHGRKVSNKEVARELKMDLEEFQEMVTMTRSVSMVSIDEAQQFPFKDRRELIGLFEELKANNPHFYTTLKDIKKVVQQSLQELPESERMVLALYYYEDMNLKEIGSVLDVTESRVSQLHSQAIKRLQTKIKKVAEGI